MTLRVLENLHYRFGSLRERVESERERERERARQ